MDKQNDKNELGDAAQSSGPGYAQLPAVGPADQAATIPIAAPRTVEQDRAGRRWRISVGQEPKTDEAILFMFMEQVEGLLKAAQKRGEFNRTVHKNHNLTHLDKQAIGVNAYMQSAYEALERIRLSPRPKPSDQQTENN